MLGPSVPVPAGSGHPPTAMSPDSWSWFGRNREAPEAGGNHGGLPRNTLGPSTPGRRLQQDPRPALSSSCRGCTKITHLCRWKEPGEPDHLASPQRPCLPQRATGEEAAQAGCCCTAVTGPLTWSTWSPASQDRDHCPRLPWGTQPPCLDAQTPLPSYLRHGLIKPPTPGPSSA